MILPNGLFVNQTVPCLRVRLLNVLHLETLLESLELLKVLPFKHLSDKEPVKIVLLQIYGSLGRVCAESLYLTGGCQGLRIVL